MSTPDSDLQQRVLEELRWDPSINAAHIGVTAENSVVTLTGVFAGSPALRDADIAAWGAPGARAVENELAVGGPSLR